VNFSLGDPGFATASYRRAKSIWRGIPLTKEAKARKEQKRHSSQPFASGRDPQSLNTIIIGAANTMGWSVELAQAKLITNWPQLVGPALASHASVTAIENGVLQVQCDSTAWATELRRLRGEIITRMIREHPEAQVREIRFTRPGAPSWKHGPRSVQGRGPRDTYG
jgi:predicted nucleic acid-binding Zn ribbon protein